MSGVFHVLAGNLQVGKLTLADWEVSTNAEEVGSVPKLKLSVDGEDQAIIDVHEKVNATPAPPI